jgi:hypothetical protein
MAYVSNYGNWGQEDVIVFEDDDLTEEQWEMLDELPDYEKMPYVEAVLAGDDLSKWEG